MNESPFRRSISGLGLLRQFSVDFRWSLAAWLKGWRAAGEKMKQHVWDFCFRWRVAFISWLREKQERDKEESAEHWERLNPRVSKITWNQEREAKRKKEGQRKCQKQSKRQRERKKNEREIDLRWKHTESEREVLKRLSNLSFSLSHSLSPSLSHVLSCHKCEAALVEEYWLAPGFETNYQFPRPV